MENKKQVNKKNNKKNAVKEKKKDIKHEDKQEKKVLIQEDTKKEKKNLIVSTKIIDSLLAISTTLSLFLDIYAFTEIKNRFYLKDPTYFSLIDRNMSFSIIVIIINVMVYLFSVLEIVSAIKNKDDSSFMRIVLSLFSIFTTLIVVIAFATLLVNFAK